jgi:hypothetical protein
MIFFYLMLYAIYVLAFVLAVGPLLEHHIKKG